MGPTRREPGAVVAPGVKFLPKAGGVGRTGRLEMLTRFEKPWMYHPRDVMTENAATREESGHDTREGTPQRRRCRRTSH